MTTPDPARPDSARPDPARLDPARLDAFLGKAAPPRWLRFRRPALIIVGLLLVLLVAVRCMRPAERPEYVTAAVERGDVAVTVTATGNLAPTNQVDVGSEISGIVEQVHVDVNDAVSAGQLLAVIDTARFEDAVSRSTATLGANEASVQRERAGLVQARSQLERMLDVHRASGGKVPAANEIDAQRAAVAQLQAGVRAAEAQVAAARAQLSSDRINVARASIRSPVAGVVLKRSVDPGQTVQASFNTPSLFIIAEDLRKMTLEVSVDEADVGQVKAGQAATFTVDAWPGRQFPAVIERVDLGAENLAGSGGSTAATTASSVVAYTATLTVANEELILRPGMTATATVQTSGEDDVLVVPNAALRFQPPEPAADAKPRGFQFRPPRAGEGTQVVRERGIGPGSVQQLHVLDDGGELRRIEVTTGQSDGRVTAVSGDGLEAGMAVVVGLRAQATP